ncbi:MAG: aldo/keto reductase [Planctomycetia bacterium]|nr:aldo/keto reductase [Planctomycetia bacterium]
MQSRLLGNTRLSVSPIGFGAFKIGRNQNIKYATGYSLPDDCEVDRLLNGVLDLGITYIDTAPAYGTSEERIGRAIAHRRGEFALSTKVGETFEQGQSTYDYSSAAVRASIERSLSRLKTDVLDLVFIHSNGADVEIQQTTEVVPELQDLKRRGLVRAIGLSGKTAAGARLALDWADAIMVEHHLHDQSCGKVIGEAARRGVGVIVKKGLASGALPADQAIRFVLQTPGVSSLVVGGLNLDHIRINVETATRD